MDFASVFVCQFLAISAYICFVIGENVNMNCVRKCCSQGWILSSETGNCVSETVEFPYENVCPFQDLKCNESEVPMPISGIFRILENNTLLYSFFDESKIFDNYCVDFVDNAENLTALVCVPDTSNQIFTRTIATGEKINTSPMSECCPQDYFPSEESPNCTNDNATLIPWNTPKNKVPFVLNNDSFVLKNNFLKYEFRNRSLYFTTSDFCIDRVKYKNLAARIYVDFKRPSYSSSDKCITKCCSHHSVFSSERKKCVESNQTVFLPYDNVCRKAGFSCKKKAHLPQSMIKIHQNTLVFSSHNQSRLFEKDVYCLDYMDEVDVTEKLFAFVCVEGLNVHERLFFAAGMIISMPFLLATFIVYALLPDRNLHMKALMIYVINLMLAYLLLVIIQLSDTKISDCVCKAMGYFCLLFFLVSFFWMNVICIDIWFTFSGLRGFSGSKKSAERKRLILYALYATGMPILHVVIVWIIDSSAATNSLFKPGIGDGQCFLRRGYPELFYFYGPMAILITANIVLFTITAIKIRNIKKDTAMLKKEDSKRHSYENDKQTFNLYLKLLFAMGVNWSMEIISWAVIWAQQAPDAIWYLTDFCNAIYGVFIFFIFVFKKSTWKLLKKRYYSWIGKPYLAHSMTMTNTTRVTSYSTANSSVHENNPHGVNDTSTLTSEA